MKVGPGLRHNMLVKKEHILRSSGGRTVTVDPLILEEGVEMKLKANIFEFISALDDEVPYFAYDGYGYRISSLKGIGTQWRLVVKPRHRASATDLTHTVGLIEVDKMSRGRIKFRIPPRDTWADDEDRAFDEGGMFLASFVSQLVSAFQSRGFVKRAKLLTAG